MENVFHSLKIKIAFIAFYAFVMEGTAYCQISNSKNTICVNEKQVGELKIKHDTLASLTYYITRYSEMLFAYNSTLGFITEYDDVDGACRMACEIDSLLYGLFDNRLLSSDMLYLAYPGNISYLKNKKKKHEPVKVKILNIFESRDSTGLLVNVKQFEIWTSYNVYEDGWGGFIIYQLRVKMGKGRFKKGKFDAFYKAQLISLCFKTMLF